MISDKYQYKDMQNESKFLIRLRKQNPPILGQLENTNWVHYNPIYILEDYNSTVLIQKYGRWSEWFTSEDKICTNDSGKFLNVDEDTLYTKGNTCGVIDIPIIAVTFDNSYFNILNYIPKLYMYRYLVSQLIVSKAEMQSIML